LEKTRKWRYGFKRWIALLLVILGIIASKFYPPVRPSIQVAPEELIHVAGNFSITNTMIAMVILDAIVIGIALAVRNSTKSGSLVPSGISGALEALLEVIYNMTESTAGKYAKKIFPYFATILIVVLIANWMDLIPGVDSIGILEEKANAFPTVTLIPGAIAAVVKGTSDSKDLVNPILPYVRALSTDLNFTVALAIISVFMTQVIGVQAQGPAYFFKFFNVRTFFSKPGFGAIDFAVSLLELISEFSKLLSFSFRLFGNVFAGMVLLFLVGSMVPVFAQSCVLLFELFIGAIQAFVFGMLTMVFMSQATAGHGEEHEQEAQPA
jgi:F-type H+-transporting ATPase subunit a